MQQAYGKVADIDIQEAIGCGGSRAVRARANGSGAPLGNTSSGLRQLREWLEEEQVGEVAMESTPTGNRALRSLLTQVAWGAVHTNGSFFQQLFRRLIPRLGIQKAIWAVAHRLTRLISRIPHENVSYWEHGDTPDPEPFSAVNNDFRTN